MKTEPDKRNKIPYMVIQEESIWDGYEMKLFTVEADSIEHAMESVKIFAECSPTYALHGSQVTYEAFEIGEITDRPRYVGELSGG